MNTFKSKFIFMLWLALGMGVLQSQPLQAAGVNTDSAASRQRILKSALRGYETALRINSATIVESAIFNSVKMKLRAPEQDYAKIIGGLRRLALEAGTAGLRYKAYLAATFITNPELLASPEQRAQLQSFTEETRNEFFALLAATLNQQLAAA